jgi:hypothetical protein
MKLYQKMKSLEINPNKPIFKAEKLEKRHVANYLII